MTKRYGVVRWAGSHGTLRTYDPDTPENIEARRRWELNNPNAAGLSLACPVAKTTTHEES